ncbi:hypothetical protein RFI_38356 [Reticulomyxa filosa]|uniref:Uncharacterized protein n=1 Tax=Reticulomyxa filosa TaxID=46433 RepID=X6LDC1_RETFI|nr:hypothetical protein RFI_38356 [Reticulomyxa filosa]|eukprot:ETN99126.1 hypothetical protein RFI_38356 [Reticulomyxa filosa]
MCCEDPTRNDEMKEVDFNSNESWLNESRWECIVIELNPYATSTGAGLFSWERDKELLKYGSDPIQLRVHSKPFLRQEFVEHTLSELNNPVNKNENEQPNKKYIDQLTNYKKILLIESKLYNIILNKGNSIKNELIDQNDLQVTYKLKLKDYQKEEIYTHWSKMICPYIFVYKKNLKIDLNILA